MLNDRSIVRNYYLGYRNRFSLSGDKYQMFALQRSVEVYGLYPKFASKDVSFGFQLLTRPSRDTYAVRGCGLMSFLEKSN